MQQPHTFIAKGTRRQTKPARPCVRRLTRRLPPLGGTRQKAVSPPVREPALLRLRLKHDARPRVGPKRLRPAWLVPASGKQRGGQNPQPPAKRRPCAPVLALTPLADITSPRRKARRRPLPAPVRRPFVRMAAARPPNAVAAQPSPDAVLRRRPLCRPKPAKPVMRQARARATRRALPSRARLVRKAAKVATPGTVEMVSFSALKAERAVVADAVQVVVLLRLAGRPSLASATVR